MIEEKKYFIDLNLFAEVSAEERTEDPTAHQKKKAREEGKVAKSQELSSSILLIAAFFYFFIFGKLVYSQLSLFIIDFFNFSKYAFQNEDIIHFVIQAFQRCLFIIAPFLIAIFIISFLSMGFQTGFVFSFKALKLDWKRISFNNNPISKIFFSKDTLFNLFKSIVKILIVLLISYIFIFSNIDQILKSVYLTLENSLDVFIHIIYYLSFTILFIFFILSIPDFFYQKRKFRDSIKMTKYQVKQERKELEGDIQIKQRLKEKQREILKKSFVKEMKKADVLITNPTHYAVAIQYDMDKMQAPILISKGQDYRALRMKELAKEYGVSIVENKILAQMLYKEVKVGEMIPEKFYQAIAEILAFVMRAKGNLKI